MNNNLRDVSKDAVFRKSALMRVLLGTVSTTTICLLYSLAHAKYRKFEFSFVKNWIKGGLVVSLSFYTGNELFYSLSNYFKIYTNFWINYTIIAYNLSKLHYRYLIRNHMMKWHSAIKYSHKCFLIFVTLNLIIEFHLFIIREIYLFDEEDIFDTLKLKYHETMTYNDIEKNFMKSFHVLNSRDKIKKVKQAMDVKQQKDDPENRKLYKTVDLYEMYKNKEI